MLNTFRTLGLFTVISVALLVTGANYAKHQDVLRHLQEREIEAHMQSFKATWKDADGLEHCVTTPRNEGEELPLWADRHREAVDALKAVFPPKPA